MTKLSSKFEAFSRICIASNIQFYFCKWELFSLHFLYSVFPLDINFAVNNDLILSLLSLLTADTKIFLSSCERNYSVSHLVIISMNCFPWAYIAPFPYICPLLHSTVHRCKDRGNIQLLVVTVLITRWMTSRCTGGYFG